LIGKSNSTLAAQWITCVTLALSSHVIAPARGQIAKNLGASHVAREALRRALRRAMARRLGSDQHADALDAELGLASQQVVQDDLADKPRDPR
jgi:hypothetical protein